MKHTLMAILFAFLAALAPGAARAAGDFTPEQQKAIRDMVRDYIRENPEIVTEAIEILQERERTAKQAQAKRALGERQDEIFRSKDDHEVGNPRGDVTLVEFFDYRCTYCKAVFPTLAAALKDDPKVRLVLKEFPILGPDSVVATRAALAARKQDKYLKMHNALMATRNLDAAGVMRIAKDVGLDVERLKKDMEDKTVDAIIQNNLRLAAAIGVSGTPGFVIGDKLIPGAIDLATLKKLIAEARAGG